MSSEFVSFLRFVLINLAYGEIGVYGAGPTDNLKRETGVCQQYIFPTAYLKRIFLDAPSLAQEQMDGMFLKFMEVNGKPNA